MYELPDMPVMNATITPQPMESTTPSVGLGAQLMFLQLLTQVKSLQEKCNSNNGSSPGEEALRTLARDAIEREQDSKRQLEILELTSQETITNLTSEINDIRQQLTASQDLNENLKVSLENKENEIQELQEKLEELENTRAKKLQEVLKGESKEEALIKATKRGNIEEMLIILNGEVNLEYRDKSAEWTALEWAVAFGHTQACQLLLERGANPNPTYLFEDHPLKYWPLRLAARFGHLEIASLLLQYDADNLNSDPEDVAKERGYLELAQMLCEWRNQQSYDKFWYQKLSCRYLADKHC